VVVVSVCQVFNVWYLLNNRRSSLYWCGCNDT
jgi:hypothetical protein